MWPAEKSAKATRIICLCAVVYVCFFAGLDSFGLVGPDEPRYASIARAMAETGDWVTPRLNGAPWFEKPPLYYWTAAMGFRVFSSPEVAARIPAGVFALAALLAILWLARKIYGSPVADLAGWMLPTTVAMLGFSHAAATDMPFAACLALAMVAAAVLLFDESPTHARLWSAGFGAALGIAVLAKGPAAVALTGGSTALWAVATGNIRRSVRLLHPVGIFAFALVALPWYVLCAMRNPEFLRIFLLEHNVERFLTNRYQHHQPFWFYVPILLLALFPWTLFLIPAIRDGWRALRAGSWQQAPAAFFAAWVIFPFAFFSAAQSKLPGYILPAIPPLVLMLSGILAARLGSGRGEARTVLYLFALALVAAGGAALGCHRYFPTLLPAELTGDSSNARLALLMFLALAGATLTFAIDPLQVIFRPRRAPGLGQSLVLYTCLVASGYVFLHILDPQISPRDVAARVRDVRHGDSSVVAYRLTRSWQYGLEFYLHGPVNEWRAGAPRPGWIITTAAGRAELSQLGWTLEEIVPGSPRATLFQVK